MPVNPNDDILQHVRDFADRAHGGQMRKYTPERYIVHPVRVMETCRLHDARLPVLAAALLHDVLEDTPVTAPDILSFLKTLMPEEAAQQAVALTLELTDVYIKADYPHLNRKKRKQLERERTARTSGEAQTIKYADILDNTNEIASHDPGFAPRFLRECLEVLQIADKGDARLHEAALQKVKANWPDSAKKQGNRY